MVMLAFFVDFARIRTGNFLAAIRTPTSSSNPFLKGALNKLQFFWTFCYGKARVHEFVASELIPAFRQVKRALPVGS